MHGCLARKNFEVADQDPAKLIAERVARRVAGSRGSAAPQVPVKNGAPVREELSALREGLHHLESKLDQIESKMGQGSAQSAENPRARVIDFVATAPPLRSSPTIAAPPTPAEIRPQQQAPVMSAQFVPATHSPWLRDFNNSVEHASQERFGVEEATVTELVEFFENEKKCSIEPGGKPCDHCSMCSSRGF